jgi:hypothetical protein
MPDQIAAIESIINTIKLASILGFFRSLLHVFQVLMVHFWIDNSPLGLNTDLPFHSFHQPPFARRSSLFSLNTPAQSSQADQLSILHSRLPTPVILIRLFSSDQSAQIEI